MTLSLEDHPILLERMTALMQQGGIIGIMDMNHSEPAIRVLAAQLATYEAEQGRRVGLVMEMASGKSVNENLNSRFRGINNNPSSATDFKIGLEGAPLALREPFAAYADAAAAGVSIHLPDPRDVTLSPEEQTAIAKFLTAAGEIGVDCLNELEAAYPLQLTEAERTAYHDASQKINANVYGETGSLDDVDAQIRARTDEHYVAEELEVMLVPYGGLHFLRPDNDIDDQPNAPEIPVVAFAANNAEFLAIIDGVSGQIEVDLPDSLYLIESREWIDFTPETLSELRERNRPEVTMSPDSDISECRSRVAQYFSGDETLDSVPPPAATTNPLRMGHSPQH